MFTTQDFLQDLSYQADRIAQALGSEDDESPSIAEAVLALAHAVNRLGTADAVTPMGGLEVLALAIKEGAEAIALSISDLAEATRTPEET